MNSLITAGKLRFKVPNYDVYSVPSVDNFKDTEKINKESPTRTKKNARR